MGAGLIDSVMGVLLSAARSLRIAAELLAWSTLIFGFLAVLVKGREALEALRRAAKEVRVNLAIHFLDALFVAPVLAILVALMRAGVDRYSLAFVDDGLWSWMGRPATFVMVVFVGDFISYWRHRLEHTRWLWPAHAIHHSDTEMTWLTLSRFHPLNRLVTTAVDVGLLALLGFPDWALVGNVILRHYYGQFIHADLPWMYGPLRAVFVSPVMHRWHHARDVTGAGSNFATVFSVFDRAFGTYYVPGLCTVPLGVTDEMGKGTLGQLMYPFVAWGGALRRRPKKTASGDNPQPDVV
jgi:sterol desaturase/sphingolipid hydroxylase (fatty acid hydroxylase superfamily)